jgi:hypothetical protein
MSIRMKFRRATVFVSKPVFNAVAVLVGATVFLAGALVAQASIPVTNGLQGYWPAEGNADDGSGNGNHGTLVGGTTFATGIVGQAFSLDGINDYVSIPSDTTLDATGPFSISAWIKRDTTGGFDTVVDRGLGLTDPEASYLLRVEDNDTVVFFWEDGTGTNTAVFSNQTIVDSDWHHLVGVFDGSSNLVYIDGVFDDSATTTLTPAVTTESFHIGARKRTGLPFDLFFDGLIDEVGFYNRGLTPAEVQRLYNNPAGAVPALLPPFLAGLAAALLVLGARRLTRRCC